MDDTKRCARCGECKPGSEFHKANRDRALVHKARRQRSVEYGLLDSVALELRARSCDICGALPGSGSRAHYIDHDHETGAVRGILCHGCNTAIGHLHDSPELLARAAWYLTRGADYRDVDQEA